MNRPYSVLFLCFVLPLFLQSCGSSYKQGTPAELGEAIYLTLKNNDAEGFAQLYPGPSDIDEILEKQQWEPEKREEMKERMEKNMQDADAKVKSAFLFLRKQMENDGVDIGQSLWKGVDVETRPAKAELELVHLRLFFEVDGKMYSFKVNDAGHLDRGWFINVDPIWVGEGK